jgi:cell division septation protein DedD
MARKFDDFDEPEGDGVFDQILTIVGERKREFAIACVSAAVILLGLIVWGSYPDEEGANGASVPIVRADAGDYKTTPDNPGGMEIPYRDSTVFSSGEPSSGTTENILADESVEEPMPRSQLFAGLNTEGATPAVSAEEAPIDLTEQAVPPSNDTLVKEAIGASDIPQVVEEVEAPKQIAAATTTAPAAVKPAPKPETDKTAEKVAKTEPAAGAATAAAKGITPGGYYIQVGSVRSESGADGEWKKIQAKYSAQLGGLKYRTQEANLGAKGTFYRIQAGPMSKESADSLCGKIKAQTPGACLVTK